MDKHQPDKHLEDHDKGDNIKKEVDKVVQAVKEVHIVGDNESSTDKNFDIAEHNNQHDKFKEDSVNQFAEEENGSVDIPVKDPVDYRQRPLMVRHLDSDLDGYM